jgi:hypothetical protein
MSFHTTDTGAIALTYKLVLQTLSHKAPKLHTLLTSPHLGPQPETYLEDMFASLFTGSLNLDNATRLWDVMVFEGDAVLVRAAVAHLISLEGKLFGETSARGVCERIAEGNRVSIGEEEWMRGLRSAGKS